MRNIYFIIICLAILAGCKKRENNEKAVIDYTKYVDPLIGTGAHGHTFPGAALPFGMVQLSPDNGKEGWDWSSGYHHSSDTILGFSHTHLSGTGVGDLMDILVTPTTYEIPGNATYVEHADLESYASSFSHDDEEASPGYYSAFLKDPGIRAEVTATLRAGFHRYTPVDSDEISLIINLQHAVNYDSVVQSHLKYISDTLISGFRHSTGWAANQKVFFAMRFSLPINEFKWYVSDSTVLGDSLSVQARAVAGAFSFNMEDERSLLVKVGLSSVSEENALLNLNHEIPEWNFDIVREQARKKWNAELSRIKISSRDPDQLAIFYTSLYHLMIAPNLISDSLDNNHFEYRAADDRVFRETGFPNYSTFSLWDTYRAVHPLLTILKPEKARAFIRALMAHYRDTGLLPVWTLWANETNTMIGYHAIPVIADACLKGLIPQEITADSLYQAMLASATQEIREVPLYREYGYIPADTLANTVSKTLEYAYDDWCIAQVAKALNKTEDHTRFMERASNFENLFDPETRFMRPRLANGNWKTPFDPLNTGYDNDYTEGNAWQYTWYVPHDVNNLIRLMGGRDAFNEKLDSLFEISSELGEEAALDVSGLIGQYVHGNEPSHHIAYLYNYSGQPWKAQEKIGQIMETMYSSEPDGLAGNEDCGQMSAWYLFSAMGFYPVNPANGRFDLGIPAFDRAEIQVGNQRTFIIQAINRSPENKYVKSIRLNQSLLDRLYITYDEIMSGGVLEFEMTNEPVK